MKKILLALLITSLTVSVFAETRPFEVSKNSYDPYIGEDRGFESLFVNPAGMAGQTNILTWDIEAGTQGNRDTYETIQFLMENSDALSGGSGDMTAEDSEQLVELLVERLDQDSIDLMTDGVHGTPSGGVSTDLSGYTADQLIAFFDGGGTLDADSGGIGKLEDNIANNQEAILEDALGDMDVTVEFTTKIGTLINGFGLGVYGNAYSILDAGQMGFQNLILETGVKTGYGFDMGPLALGVSGDFAVVGDVTYYGGFSVQDYAAIMNQMTVYGYAWGIDAGATYEFFDGFTVGAVITDIIGSYSPAGEAPLEDLLAGQTGTSLDYAYSFDMDIDVGVSYSPRLGKLLKPTFSVDYYDFIELFRTPPEDFQDVVNHLRMGASVELFSFLNLRTQYYQEYFTLGAGVDLVVLEVFGEFQFNQTFDEIGAAALLKLHL